VYYKLDPYPTLKFIDTGYAIIRNEACVYLAVIKPLVNVYSGDFQRV
jgi:hypothetical protein